MAQPMNNKLLIIALFLILSIILLTNTVNVTGSKLIPTKPIWPLEFSYTFGLFSVASNSPIINETSQFYYNWDQYKSQLIVYPNQCLPFITNGDQYPCNILFNSIGTYLIQPLTSNPCCLMFPGVGATPPNFLAGFNYNGTAIGTDYYGNRIPSNYWFGLGFGYWTDINTGNDIMLTDGSPTTIWTISKFNVSKQDKSIFTLPGSESQCNTMCPGFEKLIIQENYYKKINQLLLNPLMRLSLLQSMDQ